MLPNVGTYLCVAAILASTVSSYGAELRSGYATEELERVFVGTPTQLTLPPGFPGAVAASNGAACDSEVDIRRSNENAANEAPHHGAGCSANAAEAPETRSSADATGHDDAHEPTPSVVSPKATHP
jgi:hypothetical protein